jgi:cell wall assembly regulator SMI1
MQHSEAIQQIATFWPTESPFRSRDASDVIRRIENEFGRSLTDHVKLYLEEGCPAESVLLETVGNPIELYSTAQLGPRQIGYSHTISGEVIEGWSTSWLLVADEGADPFVIDLDPDAGAKVSRALHGMGDWEFHPEADSMGQFVLCAAAIHHALTAWGVDVITDDQNGFRLADKPAKWLFPRMKEWAGPYYGNWCSIFDNHLANQAE